MSWFRILKMSVFNKIRECMALHAKGNNRSKGNAIIIVSTINSNFAHVKLQVVTFQAPKPCAGSGYFRLFQNRSAFLCEAFCKVMHHLLPEISSILASSSTVKSRFASAAMFSCIWDTLLAPISTEVTLPPRSIQATAI